MEYPYTGLTEKPRSKEKIRVQFLFQFFKIYKVYAPFRLESSLNSNFH